MEDGFRGEDPLLLQQPTGNVLTAGSNPPRRHRSGICEATGGGHRTLMRSVARAPLFSPMGRTVDVQGGYSTILMLDRLRRSSTQERNF